MRTLNPSLALASLVGFLTAASCTLITDVDRTKIPTDAGTQAEGGSGGTGGSTGGTSTGGTSGDAGAGATGGSKAGSSGSGGSSGTGTMGGSSGSGGAPAEVCTPASGKITVKPVTFLSDGDTLTLGDGVNTKVVFEFELETGSAGANGVAGSHTPVTFNGTEDNFGLATIITDAINAQHDAGNLLITATMPNAGGNGSAGASGADNGGQGGAETGGGGQGGVPTAPPPTGNAVITLVNDSAGALGNVKITDTVGNPNLTTSGMSGGIAVACSTATICKSADECASEDCTDSVCAPAQ